MAEKAQTKIYTRKLDYRSNESLVYWEKQLDERLFVKVHRSFIVNMDEINNIEKQVIILNTGEKVPISRRQRNIFLNAYMEYDTDV